MYGHILVPTMVGVGGAGATNRLSLAKSLGAKTVIIVEGLFDRLSFVEHGIQQLANLTEQIKKKLRTFEPRGRCGQAAVCPARRFRWKTRNGPRSGAANSWSWHRKGRTA